MDKEERFLKWQKEYPNSYKKLFKLSPKEMKAKQKREALRKEKLKERLYIIAVLREKGFSFQQIGEVFNLSQQRVQQIIKNK